MTRFEKMKTMNIDDIVNWIFENTGCHFCSRRNCGYCNDIAGCCKKYIKEFFMTDVEFVGGKEKTKKVHDGKGGFIEIEVNE